MVNPAGPKPTDTPPSTTPDRPTTERLDDRQRRLELAIRARLDRTTASLTAANVWLNALNPTNVLKRGYSIVQSESGTVVTRPDQAATGELLRVQSAGGVYQVQKT